MGLQLFEGLTRAGEFTSNLTDSHAWLRLWLEALVLYHVDLSIELIKCLQVTTGIPQVNHFQESNVEATISFMI